MLFSIVSGERERERGEYVGDRVQNYSSWKEDEKATSMYMYVCGVSAG